MAICCARPARPGWSDRRRRAERRRQYAAAQRFDEAWFAEAQRRKDRLRLWVPPVRGDTGVTMGAASLFAHLAGAPRRAPMTHAFHCGLPPFADDVVAALNSMTSPRR